MRKLFSTIITFEIFLTFMNDLMCTLRRWEWENDFPQASHLKSFWSSWMVYKGFKKIQMWWIVNTVAKISPNHLICEYIYKLFMIWFHPNKFTDFVMISDHTYPYFLVHKVRVRVYTLSCVKPKEKNNILSYSL